MTTAALAAVRWGYAAPADHARLGRARAAHTCVPAAARPLAANGLRRRLAVAAVAVAAASRAGPPAAAGLPFVKYQGLGNDFILLDNRSSPEPIVTPEQARRLCDRNFGVGADGVIFALPPVAGRPADYRMRIYNSDGSEPEMCGNGIRCMARFVARLEGTSAKVYSIDTAAGLIVPDVRADGLVAVDMGPPTLTAARVPTTLAANVASGAVVGGRLSAAGDEWLVTCVSMGNPHAVIYARAAQPQAGLEVAALDLASIGPLFENNAAFPARTNTEFVQVLSRDRLRMRVWERGAGATLACGTGACATVVAGVLEGRCERRAVVELPGGPLQIEWRVSDDRIIMTGPAEVVFEGTFFW